MFLDQWCVMKNGEVTAQIARGDEAYVALMRERDEPGPNGEVAVAEVWHTSDRGHTWRRLPWCRSTRTFFSRGLFARWPPEWVNRMWLDERGLEIEVFEDGSFEGEESIWRASWDGERWRVRFDRTYRTDIDGAIIPKRLKLDLPGITTPPELGPFR